MRERFRRDGKRLVVAQRVETAAVKDIFARSLIVTIVSSLLLSLSDKFVINLSMFHLFAHLYQIIGYLRMGLRRQNFVKNNRKPIIQLGY